jgi:hypothetical protein
MMQPDPGATQATATIPWTRAPLAVESDNLAVLFAQPFELN